MKIRKIFVIILMLFAVLFLCENTMANETNSEADANAAAGVDFTYATQSTYTNYPEKRPLVGSFQGASHMQAPYPRVIEQWQPCYDESLANTFNKINWDNVHVGMFTKYKPVLFLSKPQNSNLIKWWPIKPKGGTTYGEIVLRGDDFAPRAEAFAKAFKVLWQGTWANDYYTECRYLPKGKGSGFSLGPGVQFAKALGHAGAADDLQGAVNVGGLLGWTSGWQDLPDEVRVVALGGDIYPESVFEVGDGVYSYTPPEPEYIAPFFFDFDKAEIRSDQRPKAKESCKKLAADKAMLKRENLKVMLPASCDQWGDEAYNDTLCAERSQNAADLLQEECVAFGITEEEFSEMVFVDSLGNRNKQHRYPEDQLNRRVDIVYARYITSVEMFPPKFEPVNKPNEKKEGGEEVESSK